MFIGQRAAQELDVVLMSIEHGFSIDQLMELAGLSVAQSLFKAYGEGKKAIVICGPGNNGGDGLVASRHLKHFGWNPSILYPKSTTNELYLRLMKQCKQLEIPIYEQSIDFSSFDLIVDSIFGNHKLKFRIWVQRECA